MKHATNILGIQDSKSSKKHANVTENIKNTFSMFGKSRKPYVQAA